MVCPVTMLAARDAARHNRPNISHKTTGDDEQYYVYVVYVVLAGLESHRRTPSHAPRPRPHPSFPRGISSPATASCENEPVLLQNKPKRMNPILKTVDLILTTRPQPPADLALLGCAAALSSSGLAQQRLPSRTEILHARCLWCRRLAPPCWRRMWRLRRRYRRHVCRTRPRWRRVL